MISDLTLFCLIRLSNERSKDVGTFSSSGAARFFTGGGGGANPLLRDDIV